MLAPTSLATPATAGATRRSVHAPGQQPAALEWVACYLQSVLDEGRVSASTLEAYTLDLAMLSRWVAEHELDLQALTTADLTRYVSLRSAQGVRLSTLARHMSSFRRFYGFLVARGACAGNPAAPVFVPPAVTTGVALLRDDALRALMQPSRRRQPSPAAAFRAQRDHTLVRMLYATRLGVSAVRLLRWTQFDEHWQVVRVPLRNGALRSYVLDGRLLAGLQGLRGAMAVSGVDLGDCEYCFPTAAGLPMTRQALCHLVHKWASECGQSGIVTPSALRKTGRARMPGLRR